MSTGISSSLTPANIEALDRLKNDAVNNKKLESQALGKDAFLNLMMTQLSHQDPLSPMDNQEMIAQMAQFSSVEQMGIMNEGMAMTVEQNDSILETLLLMAKNDVNSDSSAKIDELIEKTDLSNEINTNILNELINMNKALEAYDE